MITERKYFLQFAEIAHTPASKCWGGGTVNILNVFSHPEKGYSFLPSSCTDFVTWLHSVIMKLILSEDAKSLRWLCEDYHMAKIWLCGCDYTATTGIEMEPQMRGDENFLEIPKTVKCLFKAKMFPCGCLESHYFLKKHTDNLVIF